MRAHRSTFRLVFLSVSLLVAHARAEAGPGDSERRAQVLATFRGGQITVGDMEDAIALKVPMQRAQLATPEGRARFLTEMVTYRVLYLEAERRGYETHSAVAEATARAAMDRMVAQQFPIRPEAVDPEELEREYQAHVKRFDQRPERRASQIWVRAESDARALIAQLKDQDRAGFARLARERSKDGRTRSRGGDLGHFDREGRTRQDGPVTVHPAIAQATFALDRLGDISRQPVPVEGGFSVLMWTAERPGTQQRPRADVEPQLREQLASVKQVQALEAWVAQLKTQYPVETHLELAAPIQLDPEVPLDIPAGFPAAPPDPTAPPVLVEPDEI